MNLLTARVRSEALGFSTGLSVLLPTAPPPEAGHPVLYLLHGLSDDHTAWVRNTRVEAYAEAAGVAVVMPEVQRSCYHDLGPKGRPRQPAYFTWLSEELPGWIDATFRLSRRREDTRVAGLSMGGYGATRWWLTHPHRFAAAASFSGLVDCDTRAEWDDPAGPIPVAFGSRDAFLGSDADLFALASEADPAALSPLTLDCGDEDFLFGGNRRFAAHAEALGLPVAATWHPGRAHTWDYWDERVAAFLATSAADVPAT